MDEESILARKKIEEDAAVDADNRKWKEMQETIALAVEVQVKRALDEERSKTRKNWSQRQRRRLRAGLCKPDCTHH